MQRNPFEPQCTTSAGVCDVTSTFVSVCVLLFCQSCICMTAATCYLKLLEQKEIVPIACCKVLEQSIIGGDCCFPQTSDQVILSRQHLLAGALHADCKIHSLLIPIALCRPRIASEGTPSTPSSGRMTATATGFKVRLAQFRFIFDKRDRRQFLGLALLGSFSAFDRAIWVELTSSRIPYST